jgi:hypothetical protein
VGQDLVEHLVSRQELQGTDGLKGPMPLIAGIDPIDPVDRVGKGPGHAARLGRP